MEPTVVVSNLPPVWVYYVGYFGLLIFGLATTAIAVVLIKLSGQVSEMLNEITKIVEEDVRRDMMPDVKAITKNVATITDDAASATHNVTGAVNRVSHIVSSVSTKLESPAIRAVGTITGIVAGARAFGGKKDVQQTETKKRGGLLGFLKK